MSACLDGTLKFYDFDLDGCVNQIKMPAGCIVQNKLFVDCQAGHLVAGGCVLDGDEVLLEMQEDLEIGWKPVGSQLSNGIIIQGLKLSPDGMRCYVIGLGGELAIYQWKQ